MSPIATWSPEMLYMAGKKTIQIAEDLLSEGKGLKEVRACNIGFHPTGPVLVNQDVIELRHPLDATWEPFENFLKEFIFPLALVRSKKMTLSSYFASEVNEKTAKEVAIQLGWKRFLPRYFAIVTIPSFLENIEKKNLNRFASSEKTAKFILKTLFRHLRLGLERVRP